MHVGWVSDCHLAALSQRLWWLVCNVSFLKSVCLPPMCGCMLLVAFSPCICFFCLALRVPVYPPCACIIPYQIFVSCNHWSLGLPTRLCAYPHSSIVLGEKVTFLIGSLLSARITCPSNFIFYICSPRWKVWVSCDVPQIPLLCSSWCLLSIAFWARQCRWLGCC